MTYFNYHAKAKRLILNKHLLSVSFFQNYHNIKPAMVLYFDNSRPIPIREYMWQEYFALIKQENVKFNNPDNLDLTEFGFFN